MTNQDVSPSRTYIVILGDDYIYGKKAIKIVLPSTLANSALIANAYVRKHISDTDCVPTVIPAEFVEFVPFFSKLNVSNQEEAKKEEDLQEEIYIDDELERGPEEDEEIF